MAGAIGGFGIYSNINGTATRKGNTITVEGIIDHRLKDKYDFDKKKNSAANALFIFNQRLQELGYKPYDMESDRKYQKIRFEYKIRGDGSLELKKDSIKTDDIYYRDKVTVDQG